jgi:hypothetical protein
MRMNLPRLLRLVCCLIVLAPGPSALAAPAVAVSVPHTDPVFVIGARGPMAADEEPKEDGRCKQGRRTAAFGWRLVDYGMATAKYLVGLLLIPIGLIVVVMGWIQGLVEAVACW